MQSCTSIMGPILFLLGLAIFGNGINALMNSPIRHSPRFQKRQLQNDIDYLPLSSSSSRSSSSSSLGLKSVFGFQNTLLRQYQTVELNSNNRTIPTTPPSFGFGASGTWAYQTFTFYIPDSNNNVLMVWDCFCAGDRFDIFLNGQQVIPLGDACFQTSYNTIGGTPYYTVPSQCLQLPGHYYGIVTLNNPGFYNLTIRVAESYYGAGVGYVTILQVTTA